MKEHAKQIPFQLAQSDPLSERFFVTHSGVSDAVRRLENFFDELPVASAGTEASPFMPFLLLGPSGSGKTHLAHVYEERARLAGIPIQLIELDEYLADERQIEAHAGAFVALFNELRASGGVLLMMSRRTPAEITNNPHIQSRLLAGEVMQLTYPREEELRPVILSIAERRNLRLSDGSLNYLLRRIPVDPLSFEDILGKIDALSLRSGRPAGLSVVRDVVREQDAG